MTRLPTLGVFGGIPRFDRAIANGQRYFPSWTAYEAMFHDIFKRQYYTNQGPLTQDLEARLAAHLGVRNAICMSNEFIALISASHALEVKEFVVVPALSPVATIQVLAWTGARPLFCDVDLATGMIDPAHVERLLTQNAVSAILGVNPWGDACDVRRLKDLAERFAIPLYLDSSQGFGCAIEGTPLGNFGEVEVISFHSNNILGACEGAVACTQNDALAAHIRNTRSSYGMGRPVPVGKTSNGRMSEAQAAVALFNLQHYPEYRMRNEAFFSLLRDGLEGIPGIRIRVPSGVSESNYQNLICLVDEEVFGLQRDQLWRILRGENLMVGKGFPTAGKRSTMAFTEMSAERFPHAERYSASTLELPMNHALAIADAECLVDLLADIQENSSRIQDALRAAA